MKVTTNVTAVIELNDDEIARLSFILMDWHASQSWTGNESQEETRDFARILRAELKGE